MKKLIKLVMFVTALVLVKKAVESLLVYLEANDEVEIPVDFVKTDHLHLNKIWILSWEGIKYENNWRS